MKHIKKIAVALVLFVVASSFVNAQSKVAHINVQQLLSDMPAMKTAESELKKLSETYQADIQASMTELQNKYRQYEGEASAKTEEENQKRALELQEFKKNIDEANQAASQEIQKKQAELLGPITEKAKLAIEKVAAAQGFDYVLDAQAGGSVLVAKGKDILAEVKQELGF